MSDFHLGPALIVSLPPAAIFVIYAGALSFPNLREGD
jgi:hypothetical protein